MRNLTKKENKALKNQLVKGLFVELNNQNYLIKDDFYGVVRSKSKVKNFCTTHTFVLTNGENSNINIEGNKLYKDCKVIGVHKGEDIIYNLQTKYKRRWEAVRIEEEGEKHLSILYNTIDFLNNSLNKYYNLKHQLIYNINNKENVLKGLKKLRKEFLLAVKDFKETEKEYFLLINKINSQ